MTANVWRLGDVLAKFIQKLNRITMEDYKFLNAAFLYGQRHLDEEKFMTIAEQWAKSQHNAKPHVGRSLPPDAEYWKERCMAAEKFIDESPCDPDIHEDQIRAYDDWKAIVGRQ